MSAKKLSPREARVLTDLVLSGEDGRRVDTDGIVDGRMVLASLVTFGYIECRCTDGSVVLAKATREGIYRILNPGKL